MDARIVYVVSIVMPQIVHILIAVYALLTFWAYMRTRSIGFFLLGIGGTMIFGMEFVSAYWLNIIVIPINFAGWLCLIRELKKS